MGEKHPDRTNQWDKQQAALKKMNAGIIHSYKTKDDKRASR